MGKDLHSWCDKKESSYGSQKKKLWYYDPVKKKRRYYPDFMIKYENKDGNIITEMIEIKPNMKLKDLHRNPKRRTKAWMNQVYTYITNQAKWEAARIVCGDQGWNFRIITEKELGIKDK